MMNAPVSVIATGARTPLGLYSAAAAAAVRACISSCSEHPFMVNSVGEPMPASLDPLLQPSLTGNERMLRMAQSALLEACLPFANLPEWQTPLPLYLALPEPRPGFSQQDAQWCCARLINETRLPVTLADTRGNLNGHGAGLAVLAGAMQDLRNGSIEACIVGGVDSYFHPDTMEWLDQNRQLVGAVSRSGFVPGEGAGFCVLMSEAVAQRHGLTSIANLRAAAVGTESKLIKTRDMNLGEGLTQVTGNALAGLQLPRETVSQIICDINGERYRGEEWGFTCLKLARYFEDPTRYLSPADCWGDLGAASGILFLMLACEAAARGYANGDRTLLWASSESGLRAAVLLETSNQINRYRS